MGGLFSFSYCHNIHFYRNCIGKDQQQSGQQNQSHSTPSVPAAVPTPDFTTEPIDPDEPTYCLCNQVSFGEMIGCDNDDVR